MSATGGQAEVIAEVIEECPICKCEAGVYGYTEEDGKTKYSYVICKRPVTNYHTGPMKPTRGEAIQAWNEYARKRQKASEA